MYNTATVMDSVNNNIRYDEILSRFESKNENWNSLFELNFVNLIGKKPIHIIVYCFFFGEN